MSGKRVAHYTLINFHNSAICATTAWRIERKLWDEDSQPPVEQLQPDIDLLNRDRISTRWVDRSTLARRHWTVIDVSLFFLFWCFGLVDANSICQFSPNPFRITARTAKNQLKVISARTVGNSSILLPSSENFPFEGKEIQRTLEKIYDVLGSFVVAERGGPMTLISRC